MPIYQTKFEVNAPADRVWDVLTRLDRYADWNPQIPIASGAVKEGSQIDLRLALPGRPPMDLSAIVEEVRPASLFTWRGHVLAPWFFEGYRRFEISPIGERKVLVTHVEAVHGLFAPIFSALMGTPVRKSQVALNEALRARAEQSYEP
jgi:hypothetical protein